MKLRLLFGVVAGMLLVASATSAQSLAEVARQEQVRRKAVKKSGKVYTNKDLRPDPVGNSIPAEPVQAEPAGAGEAAGRTESQAPGATPGDPAATETQPGPVQDETYWRERITAARAALEQTQVLLDAVQSRINALTADFTARDDPAQRAVIARDRERALGELARLQDELTTRTQSIADIEEEARQAGVPPGWLR